MYKGLERKELGEDAVQYNSQELQHRYKRNSDKQDMHILLALALHSYKCTIYTVNHSKPITIAIAISTIYPIASPFTRMALLSIKSSGTRYRSPVSSTIRPFTVSLMPGSFAWQLQTGSSCWYVIS
jgi:hypothetical protein